MERRPKVPAPPILRMEQLIRLWAMARRAKVPTPPTFKLEQLSLVRAMETRPKVLTTQPLRVDQTALLRGGAPCSIWHFKILLGRPFPVCPFGSQPPRATRMGSQMGMGKARWKLLGRRPLRFRYCGIRGRKIVSKSSSRDTRVGMGRRLHAQPDLRSWTSPKRQGAGAIGLWVFRSRTVDGMEPDYSVGAGDGR